MNPADFGDPFTFPLAQGWHLTFAQLYFVLHAY